MSDSSARLRPGMLPALLRLVPRHNMQRQQVNKAPGCAVPCNPLVTAAAAAAGPPLLLPVVVSQSITFAD